MKSNLSNKQELLPPPLWLILFATLLVLFFSATLYSQQLVNRVDQTAQQISQVDAPSSIHLAGLRAEAYNLQLALETYVNEPPETNAKLLPPLTASRDKVNAEFNALSKVSTLPELEGDWQSLQEHVNLLNTAVDRVLVKASRVVQDFFCLDEKINESTSPSRTQFGFA